MLDMRRVEVVPEAPSNSRQPPPRDWVQPVARLHGWGRLQRCTWLTRAVEAEVLGELEGRSFATSLFGLMLKEGVVAQA